MNSMNGESSLNESISASVQPRRRNSAARPSVASHRSPKDGRRFWAEGARLLAEGCGLAVLRAFAERPASAAGLSPPRGRARFCEVWGFMRRIIPQEEGECNYGAEKFYVVAIRVGVTRQDLV